MFRLIALCSLIVAAMAVVRYDDYKVYQVTGRNDDEVRTIHQIQNDNSIPIDVWHGAGRDTPADIMVEPMYQAAFEDKLNELGLSYKIIVQNVQLKIDEEEAAMAKVPKSERDITNTYYSFDESLAYLYTLQERFYRNMYIVPYGKSRKGRDLFYVKLSGFAHTSEKPEDSVRPTIWIESTTHAREWLTTACILNFITWLAESHDSAAVEMMQKFDWFIVPIHNPDGYVASITTDRMWRKNDYELGCWRRRDNGIDPNRNWALKWEDGNGYPCAQDYHGVSPLSEPCTKEMASQMAKTPLAKRQAFLSLHTYGQMILLPYAYDHTADVPNEAEQKRVADKMAEAISNRSRTEFRVGKPGDLLQYNAPGGAYDYALGTLEFKYALTYELHPNSGNPGFTIGPERILDSFEDFLASVKTFVDEMEIDGEK